MNLKEYQQECLRTAKVWGSESEIVGNLCMGIAGEAGEVNDYLKKVGFHGHSFDKEKLMYELGDLLWYVSVLASNFEINLAEYTQTYLKKSFFTGSETEKVCKKCMDIVPTVGEIVDYLNKVVFYGYPFNSKKLKNKLGYLLRSIVVLADHFEIDIEDVFDLNIKKLKKRYPDGFDKEKSINREENKQ